MMEVDRIRFVALTEAVMEKVNAGEQPNQTWLSELQALQLRHPDFMAMFAPPPPVAMMPPPPPPPSVPPSRLKAAVPQEPEKRVPIKLDDNVSRIMDEVLQVWSRRFSVFQADGRLLELQTEAPSHGMKFITREVMTPRMVQVSATRAWSIAAAQCLFGAEKKNKDGTPYHAVQLPPEWVGRSIVALPQIPHIPVLAGLAQAPTLRADGALISEPGYDASTGIYLISDIKVDIPEAPTQEEAQRALGVLHDLVSDFDFTSDAGRSVWVAGVLSVAARHVFATGPAPIFIIKATKAGSGKTLLCDLASIIATGNNAAKMFFTRDEVEMDKRISSLAIAGDLTVCIDNVVGKFSSPVLDLALTSTTYKSRVLGKSEMGGSVNTKLVWWATGNGMIIGNDMGRRALAAMLNPLDDKPERRSGPRPGVPWKYPNVAEYAKKHRAGLLTAALTIVSAYIKAGSPKVAGLAPMGSFDEWSKTIRAAVVWAGGADPCETSKDVEEIDPEKQAVHALIECWPVGDEVELTATGLLEWAITMAPLGIEPAKRDQFERTRTTREMWRTALLEWLPAVRGELPTARELGYALRTINDAPFGDFKISGGNHTRSGMPWKRVRIRGTAPAVAPPTANDPSLFSIVK